MTEEVEFLFDNSLIAAVENLIQKSNRKLLLISPYIDLDNRIMDALNEKKGLHNFELLVLFGKNEHNYYKSLKKNSMDFLKGFPNVEIRYNERLHAKFYQNDFEYIMTSLNLYDYSLAKNIEVGVRSEYAAAGILGKAINATVAVMEQGAKIVKQDVLGMEKNVSPLEKFKSIFENSEILYKTQPIIIEKSGILGMVGSKKLDGFDVLVDKLNSVNNEKTSVREVKVETSSTHVEVRVNTTISTSVQVKYLSASQLGKSLGIPGKEISLFMQSKGLISEDSITDAGRSKGLMMKNYMGNDYIAYPENLEELKEIMNYN